MQCPKIKVGVFKNILGNEICESWDEFIFYLKTLENIEAKREIARYEEFLRLLKCFQKPFAVTLGMSHVD